MWGNFLCGRDFLVPIIRMRIEISEKGSKGLRKGRFSQKEALSNQGWEAFPTKNIGIGRDTACCVSTSFTTV
jgi:hypothetical protein